jgi:ribosomal protein S18 acetylase RimI-like enzyme
MGVSLRPVRALDLPTIERWASGMADHMSRTCPYAEAADRHDPGSGLYWYVIREDDVDVGTVWIELLPAGSEAVLGVFLGDASHFGRGIGSAAIEPAIAEFRRAHPKLPIVLRVRRSNTRAIACYRRVGFAITGGGSKSLPSGEVVSYLRMVCLPG